MTSDEKQAFVDKMYKERGYIRLSAGDTERALEDLNQAILLSPFDSQSYIHRGIAWRRKGDPDKAITDFSFSLILRPKSTSAFLHRAAAWEDKGDSARAAADRQRAAQLERVLSTQRILDDTPSP